MFHLDGSYRLFHRLHLLAGRPVFMPVVWNSHDGQASQTRHDKLDFSK